MEEKYKILLGTSGAKGSSNEDIFINLELQKDVSDLKPERYDNTFDVSAQFNAERNASRDFRIYGVVDSNLTDCENLLINCYSGSGTTGLSGFLQTITTTPIAYNGNNVYGKKRGKYILGLSAYTNENVYFEIPSDGSPDYFYVDQIFAQQVIFYDADGNFVNYGNQTIEIDLSGNTITIDNDFPFLYNKHWIRNDLSIMSTPLATVSFGSGATTLNINQGDPSILAFTVALNRPSIFGIEQVDLDILSNTITSSNSNISLSQMVLLENNINQISSFPFTLNFNIAEQFKTFYLSIPAGQEQFINENIVFTLDNYNNYVLPATPNTFSVYISGTTAKNATVFNFQNIFNNRNYFTGWRGDINSAFTSLPFYSVLRNGLVFDGTPLEFYPNDFFNLTIENVGINTVLPASGNSALNVTNDIPFLANTSKSFIVNSTYTGATVNSVKLQFPQNTITTYNSWLSGMTINGVPIIQYSHTYSFNYSTILNALNGGALDGYKYTYGSLDKPFLVFADSNNLTITLVAKNPGTRLDFGGYGGGFSGLSQTGGIVTGTVTATTIQPYSVNSVQIPVEVVLRANSNNNAQCNYGFTISKNGYKSISWTSTTTADASNPPIYYLASGYNNILRNWDNSNAQVVYVHGGVSDSWTNSPSPGKSYGMYNIGQVIINGLVLLANVYNDTTADILNYSVGGQQLNLTNYGDNAGAFIADFFASPIPVIVNTAAPISLSTTQQTGYFIMSDPGNSLTSDERSFDFSIGTFPNVLTYFGNWHGNPLNASFLWAPFAKDIVLFSGNTQITPTALPAPGTLKQYMTNLGINSANGNANDLKAIQSTILTQINNNTGDIVKISSNIPGNPFTLNNIKDFRDSNGNNVYAPSSFAYLEIIPNLIAGVSENPGSNFLGGYSV